MAATANQIGKLLSSRLKPRNDDDRLDRLFYRLTPALALCFAVAIGTKQYLGKPIQCWAPHEFAKTRQWMKYAEAYCFVENTYWVGMDERFPMQPADREQREIRYYQWMPFVLIGQALLLMLPKFLWNAFNWKSGLNVHSLVAEANRLSEKGELEGKEQAGRILGDRIYAGVALNKRDKIRDFAGKIPEMPREDGEQPVQIWVTASYLLFKVVNIFSVSVQLILLDRFLNNQADSWVWNTASDLLAGRSWRDSGAFPRVTFCDFAVRQASQSSPVVRYSLQCVLMVNMLNEKLFLFLYFWLLCLLSLGSLNFVIWLRRVFFWRNAEQFVACQLRIGIPGHFSSQELSKFVRNGLSRDGVTVVYLVAQNCEPTVCAMLVAQLWKRYRQGVFVGQMAVTKELAIRQRQLQQRHPKGA